MIHSYLVDNKLSNHIEKGALFDVLAKLHSQHPSYSKGGVSDWIFVDNSTIMMLDSLKSNEVSKVYPTDFGFAIAIKTDERYVSNNLEKCKENLIYSNGLKSFAVMPMSKYIMIKFNLISNSYV